MLQVKQVQATFSDLEACQICSNQMRFQSSKNEEEDRLITNIQRPGKAPAINRKILIDQSQMKLDEALTRYLPITREPMQEKTSFLKKKQSKLKPPRDSIIRLFMRKFYLDKKKPFPLIDIGCNIQAPFFEQDRMQVLYRARYGGIDKLILTGYDLDSSIKNRTLVEDAPYFKTQEIPDLYYTAGVHPEFVCKDNNKKYLNKQLENLIVHPKCVAVGQTGLDFKIRYVPPPYQENMFIKQIKLALEYEKPLVLHCREAGPRLVSILQRFKNDFKKPVIVHCFTGNKTLLQQLNDMDAYIGVTGWLAQRDENKREDVKEVLKIIKHIPQDRLLLETDSPFLIPRIIKPNEIRPKRNEPCFLQFMLPFIAQRLQKSDEELSKSTYNASLTAFGIA